MDSSSPSLGPCTSWHRPPRLSNRDLLHYAYSQDTVGSKHHSRRCQTVRLSGKRWNLTFEVQMRREMPLLQNFTDIILALSQLGNTGSGF